MGIIRKMRAVFHDDWCKNCTSEMEVVEKQLFMLPMMVGHYVSHTNPSYYIQNLVKVDKKSDIPTGYYACGIKKYRCKKCGYKMVHLSIFLPVRDYEKMEDAFIFENGELDTFLENTKYR